MKECIKYFMILLLVASLHSGVLEAASDLCTKRIDCTECAFQTPIPRDHIIDHLYDYLQSLPVSMEYLSTGSVPNCKDIALPTSRIRLESTDKTIHHKGVPDSAATSHSVEYYIYGLRKIVV